MGSRTPFVLDVFVLSGQDRCGQPLAQTPRFSRVQPIGCLYRFRVDLRYLMIPVELGLLALSNRMYGRRADCVRVLTDLDRQIAN